VPLRLDLQFAGGKPWLKLTCGFDWRPGAMSCLRLELPAAGSLALAATPLVRAETARLGSAAAEPAAGGPCHQLGGQQAADEVDWRCCSMPPRCVAAAGREEVSFCCAAQLA